MAQKLVLMKNQIIENDVGAGMARKFAAIKIGTLKKLPCVVSDIIIKVLWTLPIINFIYLQLVVHCGG